MLSLKATERAEKLYPDDEKAREAERQNKACMRNTNTHFYHIKKMMDKGQLPNGGEDLKKLVSMMTTTGAETV